jgi:hypothetical protein
MGRDAGFHVSSFKAAGAADAGADLGLPGLTGTPSLISTPALLTTPSPAAHPSCPKPSSSFSDGSWGVQAGNQQDLGDSLDYSDSGEQGLVAHAGARAGQGVQQVPIALSYLCTGLSYTMPSSLWQPGLPAMPSVYGRRCRQAKWLQAYLRISQLAPHSAHLLLVNHCPAPSLLLRPTSCRSLH